jgi:protein-tyrosine-phosphatase
MSIEPSVDADLRVRAARFAALGDPKRLQIVQALADTDLTPGELRALVQLPASLLAHHLRVLERAGLVRRRASEGDRRRRYVSLDPEAVAGLMLPVAPIRADRVLFVCQRNSARSQMAAALWSARSSVPAESAGVDPARRVHRGAVRVAARHGLDISAARPRSYRDVASAPGLLVSVCDVAREADADLAAATHLHWSVPDPAVPGLDAAFEDSWREIERRIDRLAGHVSYTTHTTNGATT